MLQQRPPQRSCRAVSLPRGQSFEQVMRGGSRKYRPPMLRFGGQIACLRHQVAKKSLVPGNDSQLRKEHRTRTSPNAGFMVHGLQHFFTDRLNDRYQQIVAAWKMAENTAMGYSGDPGNARGVEA